MDISYRFGSRGNSKKNSFLALLLRAVWRCFTGNSFMTTNTNSEENLQSAFKRTQTGHDPPRLKRRRPKVVIGHPMLGRGGSESFVMWLIEALKGDYDVTVATTGGWDRPALNEFYGTQVEENEVKVRNVPFPKALQRTSAAALRGAAYQRFARRIACEYDVRISAYNLTDWGLPAIHFIVDFSWHKGIRDRIDPPSPGFAYKNSILRRGYLGLVSAIESPSGRDFLRDDQLIAISHWIAQTVHQDCACQCAAMFYPPVWSEFQNVPWGERENSFVMIGRIAPEKQVEKAISILSSIRDRGHSIKLHLCGQIEDDLYGRRIAALCRVHSDWIIAEGRVTGERKASILASCRYGIQTRSAEPFGISVAEMVKAGSIVFAPHEGGQAEILKNPDLLFAGEADAVAKIHRVLEDPSIQSAIRSQLGVRTAFFSTSSFMASVQGFVRSFLQRNERPGGAVGFQHR
jgi:glycosyltransferase involved in cell wall biosynthesis